MSAAAEGLGLDLAARPWRRGGSRVAWRMDIYSSLSSGFAKTDEGNGQIYWLRRVLNLHSHNRKILRALRL